MFNRLASSLLFKNQQLKANNVCTSHWLMTGPLAHACELARSEKETSPHGSDLDLPAVKIVPGSQSQGESSALSSWGPWPSMPHGFVLGRKGALREGAKLDLGQLTLLLQFDVARSSEGPRQPSFGQLPTAFQRPPPNPRQKTGDAPSRVSQGSVQAQAGIDQAGSGNPCAYKAEEKQPCTRVKGRPTSQTCCKPKGPS